MLTATATDTESAIVSAEYNIDGGSFSPMTAVDGAFDGLAESVSATIGAAVVDGLSEGDHTLCVRATDAAGNTSDGAACTLLAVYDPSAGFVTGGGWIDSPPGAYAPDAGLTGKATFGFVAKYRKGKNDEPETPEGNTEFQFHAAGLKFHSTGYAWLVVAGSKAQFRGVGKVNGVDGYEFMLSARDGSPDTFRMKIWSPGGGVLYDNQMGVSDAGDPTTALGGGSIVIHSGGKK